VAGSFKEPSLLDGFPSFVSLTKNIADFPHREENW
jgi:hypothetical protein